MQRERVAGVGAERGGSVGVGGVRLAFGAGGVGVLAAVPLVLILLLTGGCSRGGDEPRAGLKVPRDYASERATGVPSSPRVATAESGGFRKGGGVYKLGKPYAVAGRWYVPRVEPSYDRTGVASWYGSDFHGRKTANGEVFDMNALTAAHPTLPLPSLVQVTNTANGRSIIVRLNDRGPYVHDRIIDLSRRSAEALGYTSRGTAQVRVQFVGPAPLDGDDRRERAWLAAQPWSRDLPAPGTSPSPRVASYPRGMRPSGLGLGEPEGDGDTWFQRITRVWPSWRGGNQNDGRQSASRHAPLTQGLPER